MTHDFPDEARFVHRVFVIALVVLVIPIKLIALTQSSNLGRFAGATIGTLITWWLLYRLCLRARRQAWFTAISMVALYIAVVSAPVYASGIWLVLALLHGFVTRHFPASAEVSAPEAAGDSPEAEEGTVEEPGSIPGVPFIQLVNLDPICTPYRRILFSLRIIRAITATVVVTALIGMPSTLYVFMVDDDLLAGLAVAVVMTFVISLLTIGLCFWWRGLSRGSITAARIGVWVNCVLAAVSATVGLATVTGELLATGAVWLHVTAYATSFSIFAALAAGTVALVRCRDDEGLRSVLIQNTAHSWRETVEQFLGSRSGMGEPPRLQAKPSGGLRYDPPRARVSSSRPYGVCAAQGPRHICDGRSHARASREREHKRRRERDERDAQKAHRHVPKPETVHSVSRTRTRLKGLRRRTMPRAVALSHHLSTRGPARIEFRAISMTIAPGARLGPYEILALLGVGGMGEVYKANDTRLDRIVAIKVLLPEVGRHPDSRQRFEREARTLAALSHPHICPVFDVGQLGEIDFLVMEYLEGETLAHRLARGALSLDTVYRNAIAIADALDKAHRNGVVHRDLKPGNIMLTRAGPKLLDFGLAKIQPTSAVVGVSVAGTLAGPLTARGTILGTLQYMAPEQVEGQEADARSDIFAFGAIVYEMVTGRRAFEGKSAASVIAAILEREPPALSSLQPLTPPALDHVVGRCLAKDPDERWQSASDLMRELTWVAGLSSHDVARGQRSSLTWPLAGLALALAVLALGAMGYTYWTSAAPLPIVRFSFGIPEGEYFGPDAALAFSPDGSRVVYQAFGEGGVPGLYVRATDSLDIRHLAGTEGGFQPFFSPDGQWVGFFANRKLKKIAIAGGVPVELCDAPNPRGGSWGTDGTIVFTANFPSGLSRVSASGGTPTLVTTLDAKNPLNRHNWPEFLPGAKVVLFSENTTGAWAEADIVMLSLDTGDRRVLVRGGSYARYVSAGYLVYTRGENLFAVAFDLSRLEVIGEPVPVEQASQSAVSGGALFSVSSSGSLAYIPRTPIEARRTLQWVDRTGVERAVGTHPAQLYSSVSLSPDGDRLAVAIGPPLGQSDLWIYDVTRSVLTRLTSDSRSLSPVWTPDGKRVTYWKRSQGPGGLFWRAGDGSGGEERLYQHDRVETETWLGSWTPDGRRFVFTLRATETRGDIWMLSLDGERKSAPLIQTPSNEGEPALSPDGRWLAYSSDLSGRLEVYVQSFPDLGERWQISAEFGRGPKWAPSGQELFYRGPGGMMVAGIRTQPTFQPQAARILFEGDYLFSASSYDVAPDGQQFVMIKPSAAVTEAQVVLNWQEELKRRVPTK